MSPTTRVLPLALLVVLAACAHSPRRVARVAPRIRIPPAEVAVTCALVPVDTAVAPWSEPRRNTLPREHVACVARHHAPEIQQCYASARQRRPGLVGSMVATWLVRRRGDVAAVHVESSNLGDRPLEGCIVGTIQGWLFPHPPDGVARVSFPFVLGRPR